jgi:signal transduction histidine kinase
MSTQLPMEQHAQAPESLEGTARLTLLSRLAGALAHELRNPLTTIFLHADILADALRRLESGQRPQLLHFLRVIREEVGRVDDLIQQYFWLVRLPDLERQPEDLGVYIDAFALEMQAFVTARGITAGGGRHAWSGPDAVAQTNLPPCVTPSAPQRRRSDAARWRSPYTRPAPGASTVP